MEFTPNNPGPIGPPFMRIPSSDETSATVNHKNAKHTRMHFPQSTAYAYGHLAPHSLSPPQDGEQLQPAEYDASPFNKHFGNSVPPNVNNGHPPTPPRLEDDIQLLQTWNTQHPCLNHASTPAVRHDIANTFGVTQDQQPEVTVQQYKNDRNVSTGPTYEDVFMKQSSYAPSLRHAQLHGHRARDATVLPQAGPRKNLVSAFYHAGADSPQNAPSLQQPPIQQWPTHQLGKPSQRVSQPHQRARSRHVQPSPGHDGVTPLNREMLRKAEVYRRKGDKVRQQRQARELPPPNPPTPGSMKRKATVDPSDYASPNLPPFFRQPPPPYGQPSMYSSGYGDVAPGPPPHFYDPCIVNECAPPPQYYDAPIFKEYAPHSYTLNSSLGHQQTPTPMPHGPAMITTPFHGQPPAHPPSTNSTSNGLPYVFLEPLQGQPSRSGFPFRPSSAFQSSLMSQDSPQLKPQLKPVPPVAQKSQPVDWDKSPQEIVANYADYKWSVTHYEVVSKDTYGAYDFAQPWLDDLYAANNLLAPDSRWYTHSTQGFIEGGTRTSFIVLHNATNPFESDSPPSSTTSVGVYGHDWYDHATVHWTTFAPDIRWLLRYCECVARNIRVKQKWSVDMPRAKEKRFHRAYWLAATRNPLGGILRRGPSSDVPHDAMENDEPFDFNEEDLSSEWDNTLKESEEAWERINEDIELAGDEGNAGYDHVVTGSSEWE